MESRNAQCKGKELFQPYSLKYKILNIINIVSHLSTHLYCLQKRVLQILLKCF